MKRETAEKLRDACSLLALSLVVVSIASLALTGVLSIFKQMTWAVGFFITLKMLIAVLFGGVLGLALGLFIRPKQVIRLSLLALILVVAIVFAYIRVSDLLSAHTPAMSGIVAPIAESLRYVGFLVGFVVGSHHFIHVRARRISVGKARK
jgi:hypothetical protein